MKKVDFFLSLRFPSPHARARARIVSFEYILFPSFLFFFFFFSSEKNLSEGHYSVARYERGTVSRIDGGTRMLVPLNILLSNLNKIRKIRIKLLINL